jgi:hypothetical protein
VTQAAAEIIAVLHSLMLLSGASESPTQQRSAAQKQHEGLMIVHDLLMPSGSRSSSSSSSSSTSTVSPVALSQLLQLLAQAAAHHLKWLSSLLVRWACTAVAAAGLDSLTPQQLSAPATALAELQPPQGSAAAAAAAAEVQHCQTVHGSTTWQVALASFTVPVPLAASQSVRLTV